MTTHTTERESKKSVSVKTQNLPSSGPTHTITVNGVGLFRLSLDLLSVDILLENGMPEKVTIAKNDYSYGTVPLDAPATLRELVESLLLGAVSYCGPIPPRTSAFQRKVLETVRRIPVGMVLSYGEIAKEIGSPDAARAVGQALRKNPLPIFIPCHRVLNKNDRLTGYSLGGVAVKKDLLAGEKQRFSP